MDNTIIYTDIENTIYPAFIVTNGIIVQASESAQKRQIISGMRIADLIKTGAEEYTNLASGQLAITISTDDVTFDTFVVRHEHFDIFYIESDYTDSELRALAVAAQSLRDPVSGAMSIANHILPNDTTPQDPELIKQLSQINKNLHQLNRAISNMADAATFGNPRPSKMHKQNMCSFLQEITEKVSTLVAQSDIKISCECPRVPEFAIIDAERLERALMNLLSNAIRHTPKGETVKITLHKSGKKLYIAIQDGSSGNTTLHPHLFARYLREPGIDRNDCGIGLGLSLVRKAASVHGGALLVETFESQGTKFTMSINIAQQGTNATLRSPVFYPTSYTGGYDSTLTELSDVLPNSLFL